MVGEYFLSSRTSFTEKLTRFPVLSQVCLLASYWVRPKSNNTVVSCHCDVSFTSCTQCPYKCNCVFSLSLYSQRSNSTQFLIVYYFPCLSLCYLSYTVRMFVSSSFNFSHFLAAFALVACLFVFLFRPPWWLSKDALQLLLFFFLISR